MSLTQCLVVSRYHFESRSTLNPLFNPLWNPNCSDVGQVLGTKFHSLFHNVTLYDASFGPVPIPYIPFQYFHVSLHGVHPPQPNWSTEFDLPQQVNGQVHHYIKKSRWEILLQQAQSNNYLIL